MTTNLKKYGYLETQLSVFSAFGDDENTLSKSFAFLISKDIKFYFSFISLIFAKTIRCSKDHYKKVAIDIQKKEKDGITDIEITNSNEYHIIIECKIGNGKVKSQATQYNKRFKNSTKNNFLVFLTMQQSHNLPKNNNFGNLLIKKLNWIEVLSLASIHKGESFIMKEFNKFLQGYKMAKFTKEILVQDVGDSEQIKNFLDNNLYRRSESSSGIPLYFAPYFTKNSGETVGISYISRILGILVIHPKIKGNIKDQLSSFSEDDDGIPNLDLVKKWERGLRNEVYKTDELTYYFLADPVKLKNPLLKSKISDSKGWIGGLIAPNYAVTFESLLKRI